MTVVLGFSDLLVLASALAASWLRFRASRYRLRRISRHEALNHLDLNRIVTAINRAQLLNGRAALATGVSALAIAFKLAHDLAART
jgi:hypothetical protein